MPFTEVQAPAGGDDLDVLGEIANEDRAEAVVAHRSTWEVLRLLHSGPQRRRHDQVASAGSRRSDNELR